MSKIVRLYAGEIIAGNITIDDVPSKLRIAVAAAIAELRPAQAATAVVLYVSPPCSMAELHHRRKGA